MITQLLTVWEDFKLYEHHYGMHGRKQAGMTVVDSMHFIIYLFILLINFLITDSNTLFSSHRSHVCKLLICVHFGVVTKNKLR